MAKDPTDGPDTSDLEERARGGGDDDHGGAVAHDDDAALLAKLDEFDEEEDEKVRAKKKAEAQRKADKKKAAGADGKTKAPPKKDDEDDDDEPPKKPKAAADDDDDDDAADDDDDAPDDKGKDDAAAADKDKKPEKDEVPSKALNAILREKKRAMADVERARGELVQREHGVQQKERELAAKWGPIERGQRELEALGARVKSSPRAAVQLLKRLGTAGAAWEDIANYAISQSDNAKITPEFRRQYSLDDGGAASELDTLRQKQAELERKLAAQETEKAEAAARQNQERAELAYVDQVIERAGEDHVFVAAALKNNPTLLKSHLRALTQELYERDRKVPPIEKVLTEFERRRREEAAAYGHPLPTKKKPTAGENDAANDLANTSRARAAHDDDDDDDEDEEARQARIRKKLDEMDEEDRLKKKQRRK